MHEPLPFKPMAADAASDPSVSVFTPLGVLVFSIHRRRAPVTAANFIAYAKASANLRNGVYRIVTVANQANRDAPQIEVVQFGWIPAFSGEAPPVPPVAHESTLATGIRHRHGTLSLARAGAGTGTCAYFVCRGDQPALDHGGTRQPDGLGFAAFGQLVAGENVLAALFGNAQDTEVLEPIIGIDGITVEDPAIADEAPARSSR
jgi:peptidyl-prolyl cis-trans isomerase A (cyclophilin A)